MHARRKDKTGTTGLVILQVGDTFSFGNERFLADWENK